MIDIVQKGAEVAGGLGKLASLLGIKHQAFYSWRRVPAERVLDFERVTGFSRHVLRPDIYPLPDDGLPQAVALPDGCEVKTSALQPSGLSVAEAAE